MVRPLSFTLTQVRCHSTFDLLSDTLVGTIGPVVLPLGTYRKASDDGSILSHDLSIDQIVPAGELFLTIVNKNTITVDDTLGVIDLTIGMNFPRTVTLTPGNAVYEFDLNVTSETIVLDPIPA